MMYKPVFDDKKGNNGGVMGILDKYKVNMVPNKPILVPIGKDMMKKVRDDVEEEDKFQNNKKPKEKPVDFRIKAIPVKKDVKPFANYVPQPKPGKKRRGLALLSQAIDLQQSFGGLNTETSYDNLGLRI